MATEVNKAIIRRLYEAFNSRNLDILDELLASDFTDHTAAREQAPGATGIKQAWTRIWAKFPEIRIVEEDMLAERDKVAARATFHTTLDKEAPPIGMVLEIFRIIDGRVVDLWNIIQFV